MKKKRLIYLILALVVAVLYGYQQHDSDPTTAPDFTGGAAGKLAVSFLDVGQGDSCFITFPGGKTALIDAGEATAVETVISHIENRGHDRIDYVICTHPHFDHIGSMAAAVEHFDIGAVYMPNVTHTSRTFEKLLLAIQKKGLFIHEAKAGVVVEPEPGITLTMVAPGAQDYEEMNDYSAVIRLVYGETAFLFTGDAEVLSEEEILESGQEIRAQVLKVGHHGSSTSSSAKFLSAVSPQWAVISLGENNDYGHPHKEVLKRLQQQNIEVLRTDQNGTVTAISDGTDISIKGER